MNIFKQPNVRSEKNSATIFYQCGRGIQFFWGGSISFSRRRRKEVMGIGTGLIGCKHSCLPCGILYHSAVHIVYTNVSGPGQLSRHSDSLCAGRSGDRIPVGARFSTPGPGAHPASYTMGTGSFQGVKRPGRGVDHQPPSSAEVKKRVELYLCSPSVPSWPVLG